MKEELSAIVEAKHAGVAYIMGHSQERVPMCLRSLSSTFACNFLRRNCSPRCGAQHTISLIEEGMIYYV
jgi:KUP system potassium uptake protein